MMKCVLLVNNKVSLLSSRLERFFDVWTVGSANPSIIEVIVNETNMKVERKS